MYEPKGGFDVPSKANPDKLNMHIMLKIEKGVTGPEFLPPLRPVPPSHGEQPSASSTKPDRTRRHIKEY